MNIHGVLVPIVTPFDVNGDIDTQKLTELVNVFIEKGVTGIVACGTTGEYYTFSPAERELVLTTIADAAKGKVTLIAGINSLSTNHSIELAHQAKNLGYDGLMLSANPYNFPARVGVSIEFETVAHLSKHPNIVGVKESSGDFSHALRMLQADFENFEVVCGCDDQPVDFFFWGAKSWIAGAANVFPAEQVALFEATKKGDWNHAKELMTAMYPAIHSMESGNYNQKAKAGCINGSINVGSVRLPLTDMSKEETQSFLALLS